MSWVVQLTGLVEVTLRYFLTGRCNFFQRFDSREKTVCKMGQTSHAKFIRLMSCSPINWSCRSDIEIYFDPVHL